MFKKINKYQIYGINVFIFFFIFLIMILNIFYIHKKPDKINQLLHPVITFLLIVMLLGSILEFIGKKIPYLNKLGFSFLLCILIPPFLITYFINDNKIFKESFDKYFSENFFKHFSFCFNIIVLSGSILSIQRNLLRKNLYKFIFLFLITICSSIILTGFFGFLLKYRCPQVFKMKDQGPFWNTIFYICFPLTNGGTNLGIMGLTNGIFKETFHENEIFKIKSTLLAPLILSRVLSILLAGFLYILFDKTKFSGKGKLEKNQFFSKVKANKKLILKMHLKYENFGVGLFMIMAFYTIASIVNQLIIQIFNFTTDTMVYLIILLLIFKLLNLISFKYQNYIIQTSKLISINLTSAALVSLGLTTKFELLIECILNYKIIILVLISFLTSILVSFFLADFLGFYPLEASLTSGISAHSIGSPGNIGVMKVSQREDLLSFAMIATRISGSIIFVISDCLLRYFYSL